MIRLFSGKTPENRAIVSIRTTHPKHAKQQISLGQFFDKTDTGTERNQRIWITRIITATATVAGAMKITIKIVAVAAVVVVAAATDAVPVSTMIAHLPHLPW
jgi:hypothetical protein